MKENKYFLPYQIRWLQDTSERKLWEKSRRIGATYVQSYEDVRDCIKNPKYPVWFSSADESAAKEYILYCEQWAELFKEAGKILSVKEEIIDEDGIKALVIRFKNGSRINGLSSNHKAFRSKGGKVVLDEFDWHKDQIRMYAAAKPVVLWGYPLRILSTYQSSEGMYARFVKEAKKAEKEEKSGIFSLHTTDIFKAVNEGLLDRISGKPTTETERMIWLNNERITCGDETIWQQEYCCIPANENEAFLTWDMIRTCEHEDAGKPTLCKDGQVYVGMDIGRRKDLTVIWVIELVGDIFWTREVVKLKNASFAQQEEALNKVFIDYMPNRICIDQTGMGEQPVEAAKKKYGVYRVEGVLFTSTGKQELAFELRRKFEDKLLRIPEDTDIRRAHHAVKKTMTVSGNIRFDADRTEAGHADEFWAHALAVHAASKPSHGSIRTSKRRKTVELLRGFRMW